VQELKQQTIAQAKARARARAQALQHAKAAELEG
jgi:hypothetical protein